MNNKKYEFELEQALARGDVDELRAVLGHPYALIGKIVHGKGRGKSVGMPTCNMEITEEHKLPKDAVYQTLITIDGMCYRSLTSVGTRPSVDDSEEKTVETYILDFNQDVYGKIVKLEFIKYIRDIVKLKDLAEVKEKVLEDMTKMI